MDRGHDAAAVVSELLTNALRHAIPVVELTPPGSPLRLGLLHAGHYVLCAVADPSSEAPVLRDPEWLDENGRGLQLVASLSDDWGFCATRDQPGKIVWATFATTGASGIQ
jgi:anti-sigma regulatory factor (Ser/Thr protein kinase)